MYRAIPEAAEFKESCVLRTELTGNPESKNRPIFQATGIFIARAGIFDASPISIKPPFHSDRCAISPMLASKRSTSQISPRIGASSRLGFVATCALIACFALESIFSRQACRSVTIRQALSNSSANVRISRVEKARAPAGLRLIDHYGNLGLPTIQ